MYRIEQCGRNFRDTGVTGMLIKDYIQYQFLSQVLKTVNEGHSQMQRVPAVRPE